MHGGTGVGFHRATSVPHPSHLSPFTSMNWLEIIASLLGVVTVWLVVRRNIWTFPIGIVQVTLAGIVCFQARLYSDALLQVLFGLMQVQGWVLWSRSDRAADDRIAIRSLGPLQWLWTGCVLLAGTFGLGYAMHTWTDADFAYRDAFCTVQSVLAQWWMNKRYLENWVLWIAVNQVYVFMYADKGLKFFAGLYAVFLVQAALGYIQWKQKLATSEG